MMKSKEKMVNSTVFLLLYLEVKLVLKRFYVYLYLFL